MASSSADDDLVASKTEGFKVGEKKTVEEYAKLGTLGISQSSCRVHSVLGIKHLIMSMTLLVGVPA